MLYKQILQTTVIYQYVNGIVFVLILTDHQSASVIIDGLGRCAEISDLQLIKYI